MSTITDELVIDGQRFRQGPLPQTHRWPCSPEATVPAPPPPGSTPNTGQWATALLHRRPTRALATCNLPRPLCARLTPRRKPLLTSADTRPPHPKKYYPSATGFRSTDQRRLQPLRLHTHGQPRSHRRRPTVHHRTCRATGKGPSTPTSAIPGPIQTKDGDYCLELMDAYLRLDRDRTLCSTPLTARWDFDKTVVFLVSTGHFDNDARPSDTYRIPGGEFAALPPPPCLTLSSAPATARPTTSPQIAGITNVYLNEKPLLSSPPANLSALSPQFQLDLARIPRLPLQPAGRHRGRADRQRHPPAPPMP